MKKICFVVTIPLTIKAFFIPQLQYLSKNGFDIYVISCDDNNLQDDLGNDIKFIPVDMPRGLSIKKSFEAIRNLTRIFKEESFDLVQYSTPNASLYASIAAKKAGVKIRNYHLMGFRYLGSKGFGRFVLKCIEKLTCKLSTSIECVSKSNLEFGIKEKVFPHSKATVIWNGSTGGVDLLKFDFSKRKIWRNQVRKENGINDDFVFGFVGRITKDKGLNELLGAFFKLKSSAKLFIIGNQENVSSLNDDLWEKAIKDPNIVIIDAKQDIEKYYAAIDVLVLPSYREGFGNVIIEAGAMGTPAIVTSIPGPIDAIENGKTGILVKKGNTLDLLKIMELSVNENLFESPEYCSNYVKNHFDCLTLNKYILKRKQQLLNE